MMMPNKDGVEACREIMELLPCTRVLMLTASSEMDAVIEAVAAGATGYLRKETGLEQLLSAVRDVVQGKLRVPVPVVRRVFAAIRDPGPLDSAAAAGLTLRERETLIFFARGMPYAGIAEAMGIKPVTVRNTIYNIRDKLEVGSMQGLVLWAVRNGLLDDGTEDG